MKTLLSAVFILCFGLSASALDNQEGYDDCVLAHLKGAKIDYATHLIKLACDENYRSANFTSKRRKAYNECILEHLVEVSSMQAIIEIKSACHSKHD